MARILLMEDDLDLGFELSSFLEARGYEVCWEHDGDTALHRLAGDPEPFELVVTDIFVKSMGALSRSGGIRLIGGMKSASGVFGQRRLRDTPVIAMSGVKMRAGSTQPLAIAKSLGALHILEKPFQAGELLSLITAALADSGASSGRSI